MGTRVCSDTHSRRVATAYSREPASVSISCSEASEPVAVIRTLSKPSAIAVVSVSESLLRSARGLLAPAIGRKHTFRETLISGRVRFDTSEFDVAFCDAVAFLSTQNKRKIRH